MRVIDLHGDTPNACFDGVERPMVSPTSVSKYASFVQCSAFFCKPEWEDEQGYCEVLGRIEQWKQICGGSTVKTKEKLSEVLLENKFISIMALEDARVLCGDLRRVEQLFALGVRIVTPLWRGASCIGGAWNTAEGLSLFGRAAAEAFLALGGILDLSHASRTSHAQLLALCKQYGRAPLASHSNAYSITPHPRNLADAQIREIAELGGVIGLNLYPPFLNSGGKATVQDILAHANRIIQLGGTQVLALGSDFDGVDALPVGVRDAADLAVLADDMNHLGFPAAWIEAFFFENAARYLLKNFP